VTTRSQGAADTRAALIRAASDLLDEGGPGAVTLRAVGARAGVSRGAPYGHFTDKQHLLSRLAIEAWDSLADEVERMRAADRAPEAHLERALLALIRVARTRPHLYPLMFSTRADSPDTGRAASRLQDAFIAVVGDLVGPADALRHGALLMSAAHGIAALEISGHLDPGKWQVHGDDLVRTLVEALRPRDGDGGGVIAVSTDGSCSPDRGTLVQVTSDAPWLPRGGRAEVVRSSAAPHPTCMVRLLVRRDDTVFCVLREGTGKLDLPTRMVADSDPDGRATIQGLAADVLGHPTGPTHLGFVRNVVEEPDDAYAWPVPLAHFSVWAADGDPVVGGTWVEAVTSTSPLADRHWFPLLAGLNSGAVGRRSSGGEDRASGRSFS